MDNRAYYNEFSARYDQHRHVGYHALIDRLETAVVEPLARGKAALEAGCGTGLILQNVQRVAARAVGVDLSPGMLSHARGRGLEVVEGSVTDLPFDDGEFDLSYSFKVLAHVEDIGRALSEMARVVRPGGHVLAEFYNPWSLRGLVKRWKPPTRIASHVDDEAVYTRYDTLDDIRGYLPRSLRLVDVRGIRVLTPVSAVHRVPVLGALLGQLEERAARTPGLRRLGGFLVTILRKES